MSQEKLLTKSDFIEYCTCPYNFYSICQSPEKKSPLSENDQLMIEIGQQFQKTVQEFLDPDIKTEQVFKTAQFYSRTDGVSYREDGRVDLYEVKASTKVKRDILIDVAFQKYVVEKAGYSVSSVNLVLANPDYIFNGSHSDNLFIIKPVEEKINEFLHSIDKKVEDAWAIKCKGQKPESEHQCNLKHQCAFVSDTMWPEFHIGDLPNIRARRFWSMYSRGVYDVNDITDSEDLTPTQRDYVQLFKSQKQEIKQQEIKDCLDALEWPLYFLDYETYSPAVPIVNNYSPYDKIVFQFSLHVLNDKNETPSHIECLLDHPDKQEELLECLQKHIGPNGHIVVWNKKFEMGCHDQLAEKFPEYCAFLNDLNKRIFDLMDIFKDKLYQDHRFKGSASLKAVLPVLIPDLDYGKLEISEGGMASYRWKKAFVDRDPRYPGKEVSQHLLEYCKLDTLAMVEIFRKLKNLMA